MINFCSLNAILKKQKIYKTTVFVLKYDVNIILYKGPTFKSKPLTYFSEN